MTTTTLSFAPIASRERRVSTARVDHWFKRAPQPQSADLQMPAEISTARIDHWFKRAPQPQSADLQMPTEISTARIDHWFRDQAKAGQWTAQNADTITARVDHRFEQEAQRQQAAGALRLPGLRAWWTALRERMVLARAEADLRALAIQDPRVLRDLEVVRDMAEWKPQY